MKHRRVLLFANTDWYLYNFRQSLAKKLRDSGWEVVLVSPPGNYGPRLKELGFRWIPFPFSTKSTNPLRELYYIVQLIKLYLQIKPELVHHFTIKCVLYGSIAAKLVGGIKIVNAVTGLGHLFTDPGLKAKVIRPLVRVLYRYALRGRNVRVIFQNNTDRDMFVAWGLVEKKRTHLIRGSGVNTELFKPGKKKGQSNDSVVVLFASRLMREKGIYELLKATQILSERGVCFQLHLAGDIYPDNPSSLSLEDVENIKKQPQITYHGHVDEGIKELIEKSDIVVLPSYREGTPRILIEAAAMEKPIVATDIAGCAELVVDGKNGFLIPVKDSEALANAIEKLVLDIGLREKFGKEGREIVLATFDESIVLQRTFKVYGELMNG